MTYQPQQIKTEGGQKEARVSDDNVQRLLTRILQELEIMNVHLSTITDNVITQEVK